MAGNKIGYIKAKTKFGTKEYKPGSMITRMNEKNPSLKSNSKVVKTIKKII